MPRREFSVSFFRAVLGRETESGSITEWSNLYLRHGLWDLDSQGAAMMILFIGHNMLRRRRAGASLHALVAYPFWALTTAMCHPVAVCRVVANARYWLRLARARAETTAP
jgi:hypothetical protein